MPGFSFVCNITAALNLLGSHGASFRASDIGGLADNPPTGAVRLLLVFIHLSIFYVISYNLNKLLRHYKNNHTVAGYSGKVRLGYFVTRWVDQAAFWAVLGIKNDDITKDMETENT